MLTPPCLNDSIHLLPSLHGSEVEKLDNWPSIMKLGRIIWRRCKLFDYLSPYPSSWLLHSYHGTVAGIAFNKEHHLVIPHENVVTTNIVEPSLQRGFGSSFIFICSGTGGRESGWHCRHKSFRVRGDQMVRQLDEFGMCAFYGSNLCGAKFWEIRLSIALASYKNFSPKTKTHMNVECDGRILLPCALKTGDFCL